MDLMLLSATAMKEPQDLSSECVVHQTDVLKNRFTTITSPALIRRLDVLHVASRRRCQRQNGGKHGGRKARVNGPPLRSAETIHRILFLHSFFSSTRIDALTSGVCGRPRRTWQTFFIHSYCGPIPQTRDIWAIVVTPARVYRAVLKRRLLAATATTKPIHVNYSTRQDSPGQRPYQKQSACRSAARQARVTSANPRTANLSCSWALFPCLLPKRPPSRCGKVASNLVSLLYLRSANPRRRSLAHCGRSSTRNLSLQQTHWTS